MSIKSRLLICVLLLFSTDLFAQFSGHNLLEYQFGRLPDEAGSSYSTVYNRSLFDYSFAGFRAGATLGQYYSPFGNRNYTQVEQFRLHYNSSVFELKAGNFYETIGRGILLRSYVIQGAILEDKTFRSRQYFHRDLLGVNAKFRYRKLTAGILYGSPLLNVLPPGFSRNDRRPDRIGAFQADYTLGRQIVGGAVMHLSNSSGNSWYSMLQVQGNLFPFLSYYSEIARNTGNTSLSDFSSNASFAFYGNANLYFDRFGLSAEYKNYRNFVLGAGFNEPPALVKEHSYKVLNRSTHVLQPSNEKGFQLESFYNFENLSVLTLNYTRAVNQFSRRFVFQEYFAEYAFSLKEKHDVKLFADMAQDEFKLESDRISAGFTADWVLKTGLSMNSSYEFQQFDRLENRITNQVFIVGFSSGSRISGYLVSELSNDPVLVENETKTWIGAGLKYKAGSKHTFQLFAGERRGGPACNSGVCYEVLDFKGIELRISSRF